MNNVRAYVENLEQSWKGCSRFDAQLAVFWHKGHHYLPGSWQPELKNPVNVHDLEQKRNVFLLSKFCQNKGLRDKICLKFLWKTVVLVDNLHYATAPFCHIQCKIRAGYPPASEEAVSPSRQLQGFKLIVLIKEMTTLQSSYKQKYNTLHIDHIMCYLMF